MVKVKLKLVEKKEVDGEMSDKFTFTYKPTLDDWKDKISFKISTKDPYDDMGKLGLPQTKGDIILIEMTSKNEQTKLEAKKEKEKD